MISPVARTRSSTSYTYLITKIGKRNFNYNKFLSDSNNVPLNLIDVLTFERSNKGTMKPVNLFLQDGAVPVQGLGRPLIKLCQTPENER